MRAMNRSTRATCDKGKINGLAGRRRAPRVEGSKLSQLWSNGAISPDVATVATLFSTRFSQHFVQKLPLVKKFCLEQVADLTERRVFGVCLMSDEDCTVSNKIKL